MTFTGASPVTGTTSRSVFRGMSQYFYERVPGSPFQPGDRVRILEHSDVPREFRGLDGKVAGLEYNWRWGSYPDKPLIQVKLGREVKFNLGGVARSSDSIGCWPDELEKQGGFDAVKIVSKLMGEAVEFRMGDRVRIRIDRRLPFSKFYLKQDGMTGTVVGPTAHGHVPVRFDSPKAETPCETYFRPFELINLSRLDRGLFSAMTKLMSEAEDCDRFKKR